MLALENKLILTLTNDFIKVWRDCLEEQRMQSGRN